MGSSQRRRPAQTQRRGVNLLAVPLRPSSTWRVNDLAKHIGPAVDAVVSYDQPRRRFVTHVPGHAGASLADPPVAGEAAYIAILNEPTVVTFDGPAWERDLRLATGLNLFGVPLRPESDWRMRDLAEHMGDPLLHLIVHQPAEGLFRAHLPGPSARGPRIEGGVGYFAVMSGEKSISIEGRAWSDISISVANATAGLLDGATATTPVLVTTGQVIDPDTGQPQPRVRNVATGDLRTTVTGSDGRYAATFLEVGGGGVAGAGDVVSVSVSAADWASGVSSEELTGKHVGRGYVTLPPLLAVMTPNENALLRSYPNPGNPETWIPFLLNQEADGPIEICDTGGRLARVLALGRRPGGRYTRRGRAAHWDGKNSPGEPVPSGIYICVIRADAYQAMRRLVIVKSGRSVSRGARPAPTLVEDELLHGILR